MATARFGSLLILNEPKLSNVGPPAAAVDAEVGVTNPEMGETDSPLVAAVAAATAAAEDSSCIVRLAGESGNTDIGLDGTLAGDVVFVVVKWLPLLLLLLFEVTERRVVAPTFCLLLRMLSLNLRSIVSRNLRRLWLTELSPPRVCVILALLDEVGVILPIVNTAPPFWLGVLILLLLLPPVLVVRRVPQGPEVTTALVRPLEARPTRRCCC